MHLNLWLGRLGRAVFISALLLLAGAFPSPARTVPNPGNPLGFFTTVADKLLRSTFPFGVTNIPVCSNGVYVYTPAVQRLLQLSANLCDASNTNSFPSVFRPIFERVDNNGDIFIVGYTNVASVTGTNDDQLQTPYDITQLSQVPLGQPIVDGQGVPINVYGVPWIIGVKKGLPAFNQLYLTNTVEVTRKLLFGRPTVGATSGFTTNQMFVMSFNSGVGVSFWNSYTNDYPRPVLVVANDALSMTLMESNSSPSVYFWGTNFNFYLNDNVSPLVTVNQWPGTVWSLSAPYGTIYNQGNVANSCFLTAFWPGNFLNSPVVYRFGGPSFLPVNSPGGSTWETTFPALPLLPQMYLIMTNYLQAYIIDGSNVIDYVQFHDPSSFANLNAVMVDPPYPDETGVRYQWSTNNVGTSPVPYGVYNQFYVSGNPSRAPVAGGQWANASAFLPPSMIGAANTYGVPAAEAAFFYAFFTPIPSGAFEFEGQLYQNTQLQIPAPYTPTRVIFAPFLMQANDPLMHTLASDLNAQAGAKAVWGNNSIWPNGVWSHVDNVQSQPLPQAPATPIGGRYQPWGVPPTTPLFGQNTSGYDLSYEDPQAWAPDNWSFPTNLTADLTGLGQVHRGTPWQTVFLKSANVLQETYYEGTQIQNVGPNIWAAWTGDLNVNDAALMAPARDWRLAGLLMSLLNTNDPSQLFSVDDPKVSDWENTLNGLMAYTNSAPAPTPNEPLEFNLDVMASNSPQAAIIASAIVQTGTSQTSPAFYSIGDILSVPQLSVSSPWLNTNAIQLDYGISDAEYEAVPAQLLPLLRPDSIGSLVPTNGGWSAVFSGADGYCYVLQSSTDLVHWTNVATNQPVQGSFAGSVSPVSGLQGQFFRTVLLP